MMPERRSSFRCGTRSGTMLIEVISLRLGRWTGIGVSRFTEHESSGSCETRCIEVHPRGERRAGMAEQFRPNGQQCLDGAVVRRAVIECPSAGELDMLWGMGGGELQDALGGPQTLEDTVGEQCLD